MAAAASLRARRAHSTQPNPRAEPLLPIHLPLHPVSLSHPTPAPRTATPAPQRPAAARAVAQTHQDEQQSPSLAFPSAHAAGADMEQALLAQVRRQVVQVRHVNPLHSPRAIKLCGHARVRACAVSASLYAMSPCVLTSARLSTRPAVCACMSVRVCVYRSARFTVCPAAFAPGKTVYL